MRSLEQSHIIDQLLESNPEEVGESRPEGRRIAFVSPLGVLFRLKTASVVEVLHVWLFERWLVQPYCGQGRQSEVQQTDESAKT